VQKAITKAENLGVLFWDNFGVLTALNNNVIDRIVDEQDFESSKNVHMENYCSYKEDAFEFKTKYLNPTLDEQQAIILNDNYRKYIIEK
jgi:hypothetical protein